MAENYSGNVTSATPVDIFDAAQSNSGGRCQSYFVSNDDPANALLVTVVGLHTETLTCQLNAGKDRTFYKTLGNGCGNGITKVTVKAAANTAAVTGGVVGRDGTQGA
jgi:hypothetical protein